MAKKLNEDVVKNELAGSAFFLPKPDPSPEISEEKSSKTLPSNQQSPANSPAQKQSSPQERHKIDRPKTMDTSPVRGKPRGFYISEKQDADLDKVVAALTEKLGGMLPFKVDRSCVLRLVLEGSDMTSTETINKLAIQLVDRSINQLTNQPIN